MQDEILSMYKNKVWKLVDAPDSVKPVECKWIFTQKRNSEGKVERYKARLVAKGFTQQYGVDYDETFSPVARIQSIRAILSLVAFYDYELYQMDVKTAFLNGDLTEEIYMEQPLGFIESGNEGKVCKLEKSIYGLKQASRQWNIKFNRSIEAYGFVQNSEDACVYVRIVGDKIAFLTLYVDDILLAGNDVSFLMEIKSWLFNTFEMKDLGEASYILGIKIIRDRSQRRLSLSQENYIDKVLHKFKMDRCSEGSVPFDATKKMSRDDCPLSLADKLDESKYPYASAVGSLMYAVMCTRPDLSFAVGVLSRFQSNPGRSHWEGVKRVLRYLKRTRSFILSFQADELQLIGYSDSDYQGCVDTRKSTSGYVFMFGGGAISWKSKKQDCVAQSTMEAEYVAVNLATKEAVYLRKFLKQLRVVPCVDRPIVIFCDNTSAIAISKDPKCHSKAKHIEGKYHYIRDMLKKGEVFVNKVTSKDNLADPFTKSVSIFVFVNHVRNMGLFPC